MAEPNQNSPEAEEPEELADPVITDQAVAEEPPKTEHRSVARSARIVRSCTT